MSFLKDGLSIDETKISSLLICLFAVVGSIVFICLKLKDANTLLSLAIALITAVAGINVTSIVANSKQKTPSDDQQA